MCKKGGSWCRRRRSRGQELEQEEEEEQAQSKVKAFDRILLQKRKALGGGGRRGGGEGGGHGGKGRGGLTSSLCQERLYLADCRTNFLMSKKDLCRVSSRFLTSGVLNLCKRERLHVKSQSCMLQILKTSGALLQEKKTPCQ